MKTDCGAIWTGVSLVVLLLAGAVVPVVPVEAVDVREGESATLRCRLAPGASLTGSQASLFWYRLANDKEQLVAASVGFTAPLFRADFQPNDGEFTLRVANASYHVHNGTYECRFLDANGISVLRHTALTILLPPGAPSISYPTLLDNQTSFIEGVTVAFNCSSLGGSPPPQINWFRHATPDGAPEPLSGGLTVTHSGGDGESRLTVSRLVYNPSRGDNGALIRCVVHNRAMSTADPLETIVHLAVDYYPRVSVRPSQLVRVLQGDTVRLQCTSDARPPVTSVRWTFRPVSAATQSSDATAEAAAAAAAPVAEATVVSTRSGSTVARVRRADAGVYECEAQNAVGEGRARVRLEVMYAPLVTLSRQLVEAQEGEAVAVECAVDAVPPADKVYWRREGGDGDGEGDEFYREGRQLLLRRVQSGDAGRYTCVAVNALPGSGAAGGAGGGRVLAHKGSASVSVRVRHRPGAARVQPAARSSPAVLGRPLTLTCSAHPPGHPAPSYRWWRRRPASTDPNSADTIEEPITAANWSVARVREEHAGDYWCQAENGLGAGARSAPLTVVVYRAPQLDIHLTSRVSRQAGGATVGFQLSCSAGARPPPTVVWLKNGLLIQPSHNPSSSSVSHPTASAAASGYAHSQISADSASYRVKTSRESHATSGAAGCATVRSRLLFAGAGRGGEGGNELRPQDAANYTCLFSNVAGSVESVAQLVVEHAPVSRQLFDRVGANLADSAVITCRVQSHPAPQFRWLYGATELSGTADSRLTIDSDRGPDDEETEGGSDIYESRLTVKGVGSGDYGWYVCVASNQFGESSIRLLLQPKSAPSPPRQLRAAAVAGSWLQLVWTAGFDGGHRNTEYRVSLLDERQQERQQHCTAPPPCNISALLPQTTYRLRMVAENSGGSSGPSDQIQVTTLTDISAISPLNCKLMVDRKSAQMALTAPANTEGVLALFDLASAEDGAWQLAALKTVVPLSGRAVVSVPERYRGTLNSTSVRVRLCSVGDLTQCTRPILAESVSSAELEVFSASVSADAGGPAGANADVMIASAAGAVGVLLLLAVVVGACCCWRRSGGCQRGNSNNNKGAAAKLVNQTVVAKLPPYYPPGAIDKSSASAVLPGSAVLPNSANGLISDKSAYAAGNGAFDYGHVTNTAAANNNNNSSSHTHQMAAPGFTAENNSNNSNGSGEGGGVDSQNGGSLNSQHSLWHVRESMKSTCGGGVVNIEGASGDGVALYNTNTQPLPVGYGDYGADFISYPSADDHQMTAAAAAPYHQQYGVGDSSGGHYYPQPHSHPHPHPQPQTHPSISYSAYPAHVADPDHCTDTMHMVGVPVASSSSSAATGPGPQHHGPSHGAAVNGAFDESLESGFSTPNQSTSRRVIREIVV